MANGEVVEQEAETVPELQTGRFVVTKKLTHVRKFPVDVPGKTVGEEDAQAECTVWLNINNGSTITIVNVDANGDYTAEMTLLRGEEGRITSSNTAIRNSFHNAGAHVRFPIKRTDHIVRSLLRDNRNGGPWTRERGTALVHDPDARVRADDIAEPDGRGVIRVMQEAHRAAAHSEKLT